MRRRMGMRRMRRVGMRMGFMAMMMGSRRRNPKNNDEKNSPDKDQNKK